ncbi:hypothetical protein PNK_2055 [Candidatus Protochlamydia naegleriophila]|uniref:Uncharacterized protein n=1 Tax=Candidatus Protochlamydia naegleriophila TaxID=389348 RepID=A0A0U5K682_9BACT|nr:sel1 repeat family protein [Candidatus Protochlamydia naegleriophila]CUI17659.1 hypothetical protein PNK_2055 [Candidatus Protochlamydia naegleriophila]
MVNSSVSINKGFFVELDIPFKSVTEVDLDTTDYFTQASFTELVEDSHQQTLNYIIAIATDTLGHTSLMDGCSFVRQYYVNDKTQSGLTRSEISSVAFYSLPIASVDNVKDSLDVKQLSEGPQLNRINPNIKKVCSDSQSLLSRVKFNYICSLHDLLRQSAKEWFLSFIAAHDPNLSKRSEDGFKIALIYQVGAEHPSFKITDEVVRKFFKKNEYQAFYWHLQAAKSGNADSFYHLSRFYDAGTVCQQSTEEAFKCIEKAVQLTPYSVTYQTLLANRHYKGLGTPNNLDKAREVMCNINKLKASLNK